MSRIISTIREEEDKDVGLGSSETLHNSPSASIASLEMKDFTKSSKVYLKPAKKLGQLKRAFKRPQLQSNIRPVSSVVVGENEQLVYRNSTQGQMLPGILPLLNSNSLISHSSVMKDSDQSQLLSLSTEMLAMDYHNTLRQFALQKIHSINNDSQKLRCDWNGEFEKHSSEKKCLKKLRKKFNYSKLLVAIIHFEVYNEIYFQHENIQPNIICNAIDKILALFNASTTTNFGSQEAQEMYVKFWNLMENLISILYGQLINNCEIILKAVNYDKNDTTAHTVALLSHIESYLDSVHLQTKIKLKTEKLNEDFIFHCLEKAEEWFDSLFAEITSRTTFPIEVNLAEFMKILLNELKPRRKYWKLVFSRIRTNLLKIVITIWDEKLALELNPKIPAICSKLKPIDILRDDDCPLKTNEFIAEENLYSLFLRLNEFSSIAKYEHISSECASSIVNSYHKLFSPFVSHWLNITFLRNQARIQSAIQLDNLKPVTELSRLSSSAIDVSELLMKTNAFWTELSWPITEEAYSFALILIKNLDRFIHHYIDKIWERVQLIETFEFESFEISDEIYITLNNIEFIRNNIQIVIENLQVPSLVTTLRNINGLKTLELSTLQSLTDNITQAVNQRKLDMIALIWCNNIESMFLTLLNNCVETISVIEFLEQKTKLVLQFYNILDKLRAQLPTTASQVEENIISISTIIWKNLIKAFGFYLENMLKSAEEKKVKATPLKFKHLQIILFDLEKEFRSFTTKENSYQYCAYDNGKCIQDFIDTENLLTLKNIMRLHGSSTTELQVEYLTIRFKEQCNTKVFSNEEGIGRLAIDAWYLIDMEKLHLEVLHGVLQKEASNCYVKVQVIASNDTIAATDKDKDLSTTIEPEFLYTEYKKSKCPLFEKTFLIEIRKEVWENGGIIRFWVKYRCMLRAKSIVIGEAFLPFKSISIFNESDNSKSTQIRLPLTNALESKEKIEILDIIQGRMHEKKALGFVKRERRRFL